jgi:16S rRNA C1402 N4-methylase RsmH
MGWCTGSYMANDIWAIVKKYIPEKDKKKIAKKIVDIFRNEDADDWDKNGIASVAYPEWFE